MILNLYEEGAEHRFRVDEVLFPFTKTPATVSPEPLGEETCGTRGGELGMEEIFQYARLSNVPAGREKSGGEAQGIDTDTVEYLEERRHPHRLHKRLQPIPVNPVVILLHEGAPIQELPEARLLSSEMGSRVP